MREFESILQELRQKEERALLQNKPDHWDYCLEMLERLRECFGPAEVHLRGSGAIGARMRVDTTDFIPPPQAAHCYDEGS
jgi:hypothetical protein